MIKNPEWELALAMIMGLCPVHEETLKDLEEKYWAGKYECEHMRARMIGRFLSPGDV